MGVGSAQADPDPDLVRGSLREVIDPEIGLDIVELGLLRDVVVQDGAVWILFTVTTPACPLSSYIEDEIRRSLGRLAGVRRIDVECQLDPPWRPEDMSDSARDALGWLS